MQFRSSIMLIVNKIIYFFQYKKHYTLCITRYIFLDNKESKGKNIKSAQKAADKY